MKKIYFARLTVLLFFIPVVLTSQNTPVSLRNDVSVQFVMNVKQKAARIAKDPVSSDYFYITSVGRIYQIKKIGFAPYDTLLYTSASHGITYLQGMAFIDSALYLIGNAKVDSTKNVGLIKKAVLEPSGLRTWITVASTATYAQSYTWYDHGFSGLAASPDKNYLYISSGSRTDHGEEQNNLGLYPGMREVPLTSAIFRIPANSVNLFLPNDEALLSPYLFADGTRNSFDMAFDSNDNLFATENSGDRDDPDELNWIRQGKHYGFPWNMGGNPNPQQFPGYVPAADKLLNPGCNCAVKGYYHNDQNFPPQGSLIFTPPIKNIGPDADKYRENSGQVNDGSDSGNNITSLTPHRSPLGLSFDRNKILSSDLKGDGFFVSYTNSGDSTGLDAMGSLATICDPGQDLLHIKLTPDGAGEYQMQATTIVNKFENPVDTYMDGNVLYVIEYSPSGNGRLFKVTLPLDVNFVGEKQESFFNSIFPNPSSGIFTVSLNKNMSDAKVSIYNIYGNCVLREEYDNETNVKINLSDQPKGIYFTEVICGNERMIGKIILH